MIKPQRRIFLVALILALLGNGRTIAHSEQTLAQYILKTAEHSFGDINWNVGGYSSLEYTRSVIKFIDGDGSMPPFLANCICSELKDNPAINADYTSLPVLTSHKTLNNDLSLVSGPNTNTDHAIIHVVDIARTIPAKLSLGFLLTSPQTDIKILQARQNAIKTIVDDEQLLEKSENLINYIAQNQKELIIACAQHCWIDDWGKPNGRGGFSVFDLPLINKLGSSLPVKSLQYYTELLAGKTSYVAQITLLGCALIYLAKQANIPLPQAIAGFHQKNQTKIAEDGNGIVTSGDQKIFSLLPDNYNPLIQSHGTRWFDFIIAMYACVQMKSLWHDTRWQYTSILRMLYFTKTVTKATKTLTKIHDLYTATKRCKELRALPDVKPFYDFFEKGLVQNDDLAKIFSLAQSLHMDLTYSPLRPVVAQYFFELASENKDALNALLLAYGRLEVYLGCAHLYKKQIDSSNQFCFAEYVESQTPLYQATNLWNPLLSPDTAVGSDVDFSEQSGKRIYLITGANEGGKSVFLKAVPLGAIFAQTLGIVPATTCRIAPFEIIETYLNITDNVAQGHSLFRAEAVRARELLNRVSTAADTTPKRALIVFDELFNGTSYTEATALAWGVTEYLGMQTNVCGVFATHFPLITALEKANPAIQNRCVMMHKDADGIWRSQYTVQPGISQQHVALDILAREGVTGSIMNTAQDILKKITDNV